MMVSSSKSANKLLHLTQRSALQSRHQVQLALAYKDAYETQNQDRLYEITCMLLKSNIDHLEIEKYKELSNRISEFNKTKKEATEAYEYLSANGYCS